MDTKAKVCVVGLGYIGLPTASLLATKGYQVLGVDVKPEVVETINSGKIHITEPGLDVLVRSAVNSGNLVASTTPVEADIFILAVPTPFKSDHQPNLTYVEQASQAIAPLLKENDLVILESTSPVGTTEFVAETIKKQRPQLPNVFFAHCPERVIPGKVLQELVENDRVVGGVTEASTKRAADFYKEFVAGKILTTDAKTAEMCKLTENAFRDVNIAFANELSLICDRLKMNVWELIHLANHHPRVNILQPGPGVGGHCIAVDPWFIVASDPENSKLIRTAREVNDSKPGWVIDKVTAKAAKFKQPVIVCMGVAFKANIDDLRESPALSIAQTLQEKQIGEVLVCEPHVKALEGFELVDCEQALARADIVVMLVDHDCFKSLPSSLLIDKCIIDAKGVFQ